MKRASTLGISNEVSGDAARVSVKKGSLLIARSSDIEDK